MDRNKDKRFVEDPIGPVTQYSEFISSFHKWILPEEQRERAKKLEDKIEE